MACNERASCRRLHAQAAFGLGGPAGLPPAVVSRWEALLRELLETPEWNALLRRFYSVSAFEGSTAYTTRLRQEYDGAGTQIRKLNLAL